MTRHYSPRFFFRQMPNALLARYFRRRDVFAELKIESLKETKIDKLFDCWMELDEGLRNRMDAEFQQIFALSCEKGYRAILDEFKWSLGEQSEEFKALVDKLAKLGGHCERAMVTFLDYPGLWPASMLFYHADTISAWRKRKNLPHKKAATDNDSLESLAKGIRTYFHYTEGRGTNCIVEAYRRGPRDYFFAYPEDFSQQSVEWIKGTFERRPHTPAFEIIYVYSETEGTLDLHHRGPYPAIEPLQAIFAQHILKHPELPPDPRDERVYDLDKLATRNFPFSYDPSSGIERVVVKKLRLTSKTNKGDRIILETLADHDDEAIHDLLDRTLTARQLDQYHVTQVELGVSVLVEDKASPKRVTIRITHPNSCSLKYDELDLRLRSMLVESGIEPKAPVESGRR